MIEIFNTKNYKAYFLKPTFLILGALVIFYFWNQENLYVYLTLFIFLEIILLSKKFIYKIIITDQKIIIAYFKWGLKHNFESNLNEIKTQDGIYIASRGYRYKVLEIKKNDKILFQIRSNDGISEEELDKIKKSI